jgi:hypothetical protein
MKTIGIDPGNTIGVAYFHGEEIRTYEFHDVDKLLDLLEAERVDQVVMEAFIIIPNRPADAYAAIEQIGVVRYWCRKNRTRLHIQSPSAQKYGLLQVSDDIRSPHMRSACAHVYTYLARQRSTRQKASPPEISGSGTILA